VEWQSSNLTIISEIDNFLRSYFHGNTVLIWPFLPDVVDSVHYLGYRLVVGNPPTFVHIQAKAEEQLIYFWGSELCVGVCVCGCGGGCAWL